MGAVLFRKGTIHKYKGIACEMQVFPVSTFKNRLAEGWTADINDLDEIQPKAHDIPKLTRSEELGLNKKIRELAKKSGIADYDILRINTLKTKLGI